MAPQFLMKSAKIFKIFNNFSKPSCTYWTVDVHLYKFFR